MKLVKNIFLLGLFGLLCGCSKHHQIKLLGYIEGKYTYLSSPVSGYLVQIGVHKGETVPQGTIAYRLDQQPELAKLSAAQANEKAVQFQLKNLAQGSRRTILRRLQAQIDDAKALLDFSKKMYDRNLTLYQTKAIGEADLDRTHSQYESRLQQYEAAQAAFAEAKLGARSNAISAQAEKVKAAAQEVKAQQWLLDKKTALVPKSSFVEDIFYRIGEWVQAGQPVVSLLAPKNRVLIFYIPERLFSRIKVGQQLYFNCDGCQRKTRAKVAYIASQAEYTPPIIYSKDSRDKLVYRVEAAIDPNVVSNFHPGQPVEVELAHRE